MAEMRDGAMGLADAAMSKMPSPDMGSGGDEGEGMLDDSFGIVAEEAYDALKAGNPDDFKEALRACIDAVLAVG